MDKIEGVITLPIWAIVSTIIALSAAIIFLFKYILKNHKENSQSQIEIIKQVSTLVANNTDQMQSSKETNKEMKQSMDRLTESIMKATSGRKMNE